MLYLSMEGKEEGEGKEREGGKTKKANEQPSRDFKRRIMVSGKAGECDSNCEVRNR